MITCLLQGGLGNQMFQIATATALASDYNDEAVFSTQNHHLPLQGRKVINYLDNIFSRVKIIDAQVEYKSIFQEPSYSYTPIVYTPHMMLVGYFQSEKYFKHHAKKIQHLFSPTPVVEKYLQERYGSILNTNTTSLHVRRGDYLKFKDTHPLCEKEYYYQALDCIPEKDTVLIFSDDLKWCQTNLDVPNAIFIENESDYIDLFLMSKCKCNIIANSSFSWWGAWLNNNPEKTVIAPKRWFSSNVSHDTLDLLPMEWETM